MKNVKKLSDQELHMNSKSSWHDQYKDSAWIFVGGLPYDLSEGDIICIFSQYGEIVNINLIRDKDSGKSKGFCFICYEDQRSTVLAVDNFNGIKILNRTIRVDHVSNYKVPKEGKKTDAETKKLYQEGCAPTTVEPVKPAVVPPPAEDLRYTLADQIVDGVRLPPRLPIDIVKIEKLSDEETTTETKEKVEVKKEKKKKKHKKKNKKKKKESSSDSESGSSNGSSEDDRKYKKRKHEGKEKGKARDDEKRQKK